MHTTELHKGVEGERDTSTDIRDILVEISELHTPKDDIEGITFFITCNSVKL